MVIASRTIVGETVARFAVVGKVARIATAVCLVGLGKLELLMEKGVKQRKSRHHERKKKHSSSSSSTSSLPASKKGKKQRSVKKAKG